MRALLFALLLLCGFGNHAFAQEIGPGDTLQISVLQDPQLNRTVVVGPDGMIGFPLAGHIQAGGMSAQQLERVLRSRLARNYKGKVDVTVSLAAVNPVEQSETKPRVYISGEVLKPGSYILKPRINVAQAIALAGGLGPFAASKRIQVHQKIRGVDSVQLFNYDAYQAGEATPGNVTLHAGDVIIVPERGLFN